jgi:hypothetical protein
MRTVLSAVLMDGLWRVEITWANGTKHHVGKFASESEAGAWIDQHRWFAEKDAEPSRPRRPKKSLSRRRGLKSA